MKASSGASRVAVIDRVHQALESLGLAEMNGPQDEIRGQ